MQTGVKLRPVCGFAFANEPQICVSRLLKKLSFAKMKDDAALFQACSYQWAYIWAGETDTVFKAGQHVPTQIPRTDTISSELDTVYRTYSILECLGARNRSLSTSGLHRPATITSCAVRVRPGSNSASMQVPPTVMLHSAMFWRRLQAGCTSGSDQQELSDELLMEARTIKHVAQQHVFKVAKDIHTCYSGPVRSS